VNVLVALLVPTHEHHACPVVGFSHEERPKVRRLLLIRLFQHGTISSVGACRARPFRRICASFNASLRPKRRASTTWPRVAGPRGSDARDVGTTAFAGVRDAGFDHIPLKQPLGGRGCSVWNAGAYA
jgi:hypothetical protein